MTTSERPVLGTELGGHGAVTYVPPSARWGRRRRRPTGAPPPLPRTIGTTGKLWLACSIVLVTWMVVTVHSEWARRVTDRVDAAISRAFARARTGWLTDILRAVDRAATGWTLSVVAICLLASMILFRRWRHLFTFLASAFVFQLLGVWLIGMYARPRPYDVTQIGRWDGYSLPSAAVAIVSFAVVGVIYAAVVPGRPRTIAKLVGLGVVALVAIARLYLGLDHPFDVLTAVAIGVVIPLLAFRFFTPNEFFPVAYRRGKTAHLDVTGRRGEAIRQAVRDQLGLTVVDSKPVGLAGSGGSTPLRLRIAGDPDTYLFGKLYAMNHVRADRWYKLGRTILYGNLEDEKPFRSVRQLIQHEDYAMRLLGDAGLPTARSVGIVELTPDREYLLVTEFFEGAEEIGDAEVDDQIIDEGLALIRQLWNSGVAHRDIKPANLLVRDGHLHLIDVAFAQVRPSPWREAVDLANMMLVLAVRTDPERVYQRALAYFTPDEIAEAFAAARGVASPTQLRVMLKKDGRDLVAQFRSLAPRRQPISLQRWGPRRIVLVLALLGGLFLFAQAVYGMFTPAELPLNDPGRPGRNQAAATCGTNDVMVLMAQSVPTAPSIPCISSFPAGWELGQVIVERGHSHFELLASENRVEVSLEPERNCQIGTAVEVPSEELGARRFEAPTQLPPDVRATRTYLFDGACVTVDFDLDDAASASLMVELDSALSFQPRDELVDHVGNRTGLSLCGLGAPPCVGET
jgi:membrane-associated phospholipid phosphatase